MPNCMYAVTSIKIIKTMYTNNEKICILIHSGQVPAAAITVCMYVMVIKTKFQSSFQSHDTLSGTVTMYVMFCNAMRCPSGIDHAI